MAISITTTTLPVQSSTSTYMLRSIKGWVHCFWGYIKFNFMTSEETWNALVTCSPTLVCCYIISDHARPTNSLAVPSPSPRVYQCNNDLREQYFTIVSAPTFYFIWPNFLFMEELIPLSKALKLANMPCPLAYSRVPGMCYPTWCR